MKNFLMMVAAVAANFAVLGAVFYGVWYWGKTEGIAEGHSMAIKQALRTNPPSEELEAVCAGLWFSGPHKNHWSKK